MLFLENSQIGTCFSWNNRFGYIFSHGGGVCGPGRLTKKNLPRVLSEIPEPPCGCLKNKPQVQHQQAMTGLYNMLKMK